MQPTGYHAVPPAPNMIPDYDPAPHPDSDQFIHRDDYLPDPSNTTYPNYYAPPPPPNMIYGQDYANIFMPPQPGGASFPQVPRMDNDLRYMHPGLNLPFPAMRQGASYASGVRQLNLNMNVTPGLVLDQGFPEPMSLAPGPNVGNFFCGFPVPAPSMDGISSVPSAVGDVPSITALRPGPTSGSTNRRGSKKPYELQIIDCSGPPQKGRRRKNRSEASKSRASRLDEAHSAVPESSRPAATGSSLPSVKFPPLTYDESNPIHDRIVSFAENNLTTLAVNDCAVLTSLERDDLVRQELTRAVAFHCLDGNIDTRQDAEVQEFSKDWSTENADTLYMRLTASSKLIMALCKKLARNKVERGYELRPSAFSGSSEADLKKSKINSLIADEACPLKFIFGRDEETGNMYAFEHEVVWDVVLDVVTELDYGHLIQDLDNLFCTAAAAVRCALQELSSGKFVDVEFSAQAFGTLYFQLKNYIRDHIIPDGERSQRWRGYKEFTKMRLKELSRRRE